MPGATINPASPSALVALTPSTDRDGVLDVLLAGWGDDFGAGRNLLLGRLRALRAKQDPETLARVALVAYRTLIPFGEESGDMRFVHLAVECRDALLHGL